MGPVLGRLFSTIKMRAFAFVLLAAASEVSWLVLTTPTVSLAVSVPSVTVPTPDMLATLALDTLAMLALLLLPPLPTPELFLLPLFTLVLSQPPPSTDTPDTSMASVRLRLTLMLMLTPSVRSLLDSQSTMPMLLDTPTMLELGPAPPTLPLSTLDMPPMPLPPTLMPDTDTQVSTLTPPLLSMDMLDTSMASVRLTLMLMPTPSDRSLLDSQSTTPMLPDTPTMSELLPELLTPLPSTLDTPPMLLPPTPPDTGHLGYAGL